MAYTLDFFLEYLEEKPKSEHQNAGGKWPYIFQSHVFTNRHWGINMEKILQLINQHLNGDYIVIIYCVKHYLTLF